MEGNHAKDGVSIAHDKPAVGLQEMEKAFGQGDRVGDGFRSRGDTGEDLASPFYGEGVGLEDAEPEFGTGKVNQHGSEFSLLLAGFLDPVYPAFGGRGVAVAHIDSCHVHSPFDEVSHRLKGIHGGTQGANDFRSPAFHHR
jgi:hypothetical protein